MPGRSARLSRQAATEWRAEHDAVEEILSLTYAGRALLALGNAKAALAATREAVRVHLRSGVHCGLHSAAQLWWWHSEALRANGLAAARMETLERAYRVMLALVAGLRDDGIRRGWLHRVDAHRRLHPGLAGAARTRRWRRRAGGAAAGTARRARAGRGPGCERIASERGCAMRPASMKRWSRKRPNSAAPSACCWC